MFMSKITYRPDFDYKKDYSTVGVDVARNVSVETPGGTYVPSDQRVTDLLDRLNSIQSACIYLPKDISIIVNDLTTISRVIISKISPSHVIVDIEYPEENSQDIDYHNGVPVNTGPNNGNIIENDIINDPNYNLYSDAPKGIKKRRPVYDESFDKSMRNTRNIMPEDYEIPVGNVKVGTTLDRNYFDTIDAYDDIMFEIVDSFTSNLSDVISSFVTNTINMLKRNNLTSNIYDKYDKHTNEVPEKYKHLSDNIIRNEVIYDQNIRLAKKLFNYKSATTHYLACSVSKKFCDRYKNEYKDLGSSIEAVFQRTTLEDTLNTYKNKYENNLDNLNKFFSSSVHYIGDNLNIIAQNAIYKALINNTGN